MESSLVHGRRGEQHCQETTLSTAWSPRHNAKKTARVREWRNDLLEPVIDIEPGTAHFRGLRVLYLFYRHVFYHYADNKKTRSMFSSGSKNIISLVYQISDNAKNHRVHHPEIIREQH